jgi:hypothetical protein
VKLSIRRTFVVIFMLGLFALAARGIQDPDFWWHLRTGQYIVQTHSVPRHDPFSYTRAGQPWITHEWLSEAIFYLLYRSAGWAGLSVFFGIIIAASFVITYWRCAGRPYIAAAVVLLGAIATASAWGVRPQMFSLLFTAVILLLLDRASSANPRSLWWIVPTMVVWVNLHAGFALGLALLGLAAVGWSLETWLGERDWDDLKPRLRTLALVFLFCLAAVPLNPSGWKLYRYPLDTLRSRTMQAYIVEWTSPNFHDHDFLPLLAFILVLVLAVAISPKKPRATWVVLLLATAYGGLNSMRHIPIFVLVATPLMAECLQAWLEQRSWHGLSEPGASPTAVKSALNLVLIAAMMAFVVVRVAIVAKRQPGLEAKHFPSAAVTYLATQRPPAPLFNYYDWGGYFIWKLYPEYRVFIDGRADLYGDELMDTFTRTSSGQDDWSEALQKYHVQTVVVPPKTGVAGLLRENAGWRQDFADEQAVIFTRR